MSSGAVAELARQWRAAVGGTAFVPMPQRELDRLLSDLLSRLVIALTAEPFGGEAAAQVGVALVRANLTDPQVLARTAPALAPLVELLDIPVARLTAALGELSCGYTEELLATRARHQEMLHEAMAAARHAAEVRFRVVFDNATVAIGLGDIAGRFVEVNPTLAAMLGKTRTQLRGRSVTELEHPADRVEVGAGILHELLATESGTRRLELRYARPDGGDGWAQWAITLVPQARGRAAYLLIVGEDNTERRALQAELHRQAHHDPLTGLPNRRRLVHGLDEIIAAAGRDDRIGLGFIDLDGFKKVNDTYGHAVGDRLLTVAAQRMAARVAGAMLARVGGDEFVVLLAPPCDPAQLAGVAKTLLNALAEPIVIGRHRLAISACIGAVVTPVAGSEAELLLDAADAGLYRAKAAGPNRWVLRSIDIAPVATGLR